MKITVNIKNNNSKEKCLVFNTIEEYDKFKSCLKKTIEQKKLEIYCIKNPIVSEDFFYYTTVCDQETFFNIFFEETIDYVFKQLKIELEEVVKLSFYSRDLIKRER